MIKSGNFPLKQIIIILASLLILTAVFYYYQYKTGTFKRVKDLTEASPISLSKNFNQSLQNSPYTCPTLKSFCQNSQNFKESFLMVIAPSEAPLFASFAGELAVLDSLASLAQNNQKDSYTTITITNRDRGLIGYYHFKGEVLTKNTTVKEGETIGKLSGQGLGAFEDNTFVFQLIKLDIKSQKLGSLGASDFK